MSRVVGTDELTDSEVESYAQAVDFFERCGIRPARETQISMELVSVRSQGDEDNESRGHLGERCDC